MTPATGRIPRTLHEAVRVALEAAARYKLRTSLSVLGVVLGVAAVIAMMSVTDGARREALEQVQLLGLDNLVARNRTLTLGEARGAAPAGLTVGVLSAGLSKAGTIEAGAFVEDGTAPGVAVTGGVGGVAGD